MQRHAIADRTTGQQSPGGLHGINIEGVIPIQNGQVNRFMGTVGQPAQERGRRITNFDIDANILGQTQGRGPQGLRGPGMGRGPRGGLEERPWDRNARRPGPPSARDDDDDPQEVE